MDPKEQVVNALNNSLQPDPQKLKNATTFLTEMRKEEGYCLALMQIIDAEALAFPIKQAALVQLKNTIKLKWHNKKSDLSSKDKQIIRSAIVRAIIRCSRDYRLVKLYREVLTIIVGHQYKVWLPLDQLIDKMRKAEDLPSVFHCLIAIASSFQFTITEQERTNFFKILKKVLPQLFKTLQTNNTSELIYLSIKFLWKALHYQIDDGVKQLSLNWMGLLKMVIGSQNASFDNNKKFVEHQDKNSQQFFYFHSKKWATRIILRFIQKHARMNVNKKDQSKVGFSEEWYKSYGYQFAQTILKQLTVSTALKVRYFQMKCIQCFGSQRPDSIKPYADNLQYEHLIPYMTLKQEDEELASSDPIEFLNRESEPCMNFTNLKRVATDIWICIAEMESKVDKEGKVYTPGPFLVNNMNYLKGKLESENQLEKQYAMYLLCQMRSVIMKHPQIKSAMPELIANYVVPEFSNKITFLRARAVDIFYQYGSLAFPIEVLQKVTEGVFICLTRDEHAIVRIKAASAFNSILRHKSAKQLVRPLLKDILTVYLKLLEQYDIEILVSSLESIVQDFATEIQPFALDLTRYMMRLFAKLFNKDVEQSNNDDYNGENELAAAGCLKTVTQIIEAPLSQQALQSLQGEVVNLCYFVFTGSGTDYIEELLALLNRYIFKVNNLSPDLWFFYQIIIYNIIGIPKWVWTQIQNAPISQKQKEVMVTVRVGGNTDLMEQSCFVLRNFIRKAATLTANNAQTFRANLLQLLLLMVGELYKRGPGQYTGELELVCCTTMLSNYLQNFQNIPEPILHHIMAIAKVNSHKLKSRNMKSSNCQLIALLIYRGGAPLLTHMHKENTLEILLKEILHNENKIQADFEYQRMILGLSTLITLPERPQPLMEKFPSLFKLLIKFIKKDVNLRLKKADIQVQITICSKGQTMRKNTYDEEEEDSFDQEHLQRVLDGEQDEDDDEQDFWEECHDENYDSLLNHVDELKYFQASILKIQREQPQFYPNLMQILPQQQLATLEPFIQKAIQVFSQTRGTQ